VKELKNKELNSKIRIATNYPLDALSQNAELDTINSAEAHTLDEAFRARVRRSPDKIAYRQFDKEQVKWVESTWSEMAEQVERWQVAFREAGLVKGDRVAICYRNSIEWVLFDQAALRLGLVVVPIYASDRADNIAYILSHSGSKLVLFMNAMTWLNVLASDEDLACVNTVLAFTDMRKDTSQPVILVADWLPEKGQHFERGLAEPDDLASIVYTSGTTGRAKGVMLSHKNILTNAYNGMRSVALTPNDELLSFLPLSHTFERTIGYYSAMISGSSVAFNRSIPKISEDLAQLKPTVMISVPRIFERIHNQIITSLNASSSLERFMFNAATKVGLYKFKYQQGSVSWHPKLVFAPILDRLVAQRVRERLGGRLNFVIIGGAAMSEKVANMFIALGIPLLQGYGLTESSPVISVNTKQQNCPDSIGLPLRGVEAKLEADNELWVKGDSIMLGYWQNEQATKETIVDAKDGRWLKTGDCASIDNQGFIRIVGRIKDILVLANGEKVPPTDIEMAIAREPLFDQVMVVGEARPFLSALVVLNVDNLNSLIKEKSWTNEDVENGVLSNFLLKTIAVQMKDFPGYAKIRKVHICNKAWSIEDGLLTSTMKIKRPKITSHYQEAIDKLYVGHGVV